MSVQNRRPVPRPARHDASRRPAYRRYPPAMGDLPFARCRCRRHAPSIEMSDAIPERAKIKMRARYATREMHDMRAAGGFDDADKRPRQRERVHMWRRRHAAPRTVPRLPSSTQLRITRYAEEKRRRTRNSGAELRRAMRRAAAHRSRHRPLSTVLPASEPTLFGLAEPAAEAFSPPAPALRDIFRHPPEPPASP